MNLEEILIIIGFVLVMVGVIFSCLNSESDNNIKISPRSNFYCWRFYCFNFRYVYVINKNINRKI